jgi:predicted AlkP superfamily pyrophosphatase or phosphodiesterase
MHIPRKNLAVAIVLCFIAASLAATSAQAFEKRKPRLVLQITVDGLRGDLPLRYADRLGKGGFRYLLEKGTYYSNAHYQHSNTETIVGHVILATGAFPSASGMVANVWLDRESGKLAYNIEDDRYRTLSAVPFVDKKTEIDPTQKAAQTDGRSPKAILTSTFSDELFVSTAGRSKIFGVSIKDRGAVSLAGHAGKAFWFSKKTGEFVTSTYYYDEYPNWVAAWNDNHPSDAYQGKSWELMHDRSTYVFGEADDRQYETDFPGYGRTFPHPFGDKSSKYFYTLLTVSPAGDELTLDFAKALIDNEQLGQDDITDYLSVSFSSTDYVGHLFGPSSLEAEDNILRLDRTLADLLQYVDKKVGLKNTLIVLAADHGAPEAPEYMASLGMETGRLTPSEIDTSPLMEALKQRFGIDGELIKLYYHPYIYLDRKVIREKGLDQAEVERVIAAELMKLDGIAAAVPSSDLLKGDLPDTPLIRQIRRNFHSKRSGDIYLVQEPYWFLYSDSSIPLCTIHGSPWRYDTYVPIIFAGANVSAERIDRLVHPVDIAPTLSAYLGIKPPAGAVGTPLIEVLRR